VERGGRIRERHVYLKKHRSMLSCDRNWNES
jgi:hypothetical protein